MGTDTTTDTQTGTGPGSGSGTGPGPRACRTTPAEPERLFSAAFWVACEQEAADLLRGLAGARGA